MSRSPFSALMAAYVAAAQSLYTTPVLLGDEITVHLEVTDKRDDKGFVTLDCRVLNQRDEAVATGLGLDIDELRKQAATVGAAAALGQCRTPDLLSYRRRHHHLAGALRHRDQGHRLHLWQRENTPRLARRLGEVRRR